MIKPFAPFAALACALLLGSPLHLQSPLISRELALPTMMSSVRPTAIPPQPTSAIALWSVATTGGFWRRRRRTMQIIGRKLNTVATMQYLHQPILTNWN